MKFDLIARGLKDLPGVKWNYRFESVIAGDWTSRLYAFYNESRFAEVHDWFEYGLKDEYWILPTKYFLASQFEKDHTVVQISFVNRLDAIRFALEWAR